MKVDHIGIAVNDENKSLERYKLIFPDLNATKLTAKDGSMEIVMIHADNVKIELLRPIKEDSPIGSFLKKKGEGIHHISFKTANAKDMMKKVTDLGLRALTEEPYIGAEGHLVFFMHPKDMGGVLYEFCEAETSYSYSNDNSEEE